jgi:glycosyltransferase involved in cell wall biosynthesis
LRTYNEEVNLPKALDSLFHFCDEVVISDGGSTDGTKSVADYYRSLGFGVVWLDFPEGSISKKVHFNHAGRQFNFGLEHCRGDWVITCDVDSMHCEYLQAHLRNILTDNPHDALLMYGVHIVGDWGHYAGELGTGPGLAQLFRRQDGVKFPNRAEHVACVDHFKWDNLGLIQGGVYHWGYVDRNEEIAKIQLRHIAIPDDETYADLTQTPSVHKPRPIPWVRCHANCISCWMEEIVLDGMVEQAAELRAEIVRMARVVETNLNASLLANRKELIELQSRNLGDMKNSLASADRRYKALSERAEELKQK